MSCIVKCVSHASSVSLVYIPSNFVPLGFVLVLIYNVAFQSYLTFDGPDLDACFLALAHRFISMEYFVSYER